MLLVLCQVQTLLVGITDKPYAASSATSFDAVKAVVKEKLPLPAAFFRPLQLLVTMQVRGERLWADPLLRVVQWF